jgi:hypothetical protein
MEARMSKEFDFLFKTTAATVEGIPCPDLPVDLDWKLMNTLMREQAVPALACRAIANSDFALPQAIRSWAKNQYLFLSAKESYRRGEALKLIGRIEKLGINPIVLKGFAVGRYYASPDCRISGDLDLLIHPNDEARLCAYLANKENCQITARVLGNHSIVQHPLLGMIEIHVSLYYEYTSQQWFEGRATDPKFPPIRISDPEGEYSTLCPQDTMLFLLLHAAKHFVTGGLNIRVICDCVIYYLKNSEKLDMKQIWDLLDELKLSTLAECFFLLGQNAGFELCGELRERIESNEETLLPLARKLAADIEEHIFIRDDESYSRIKTQLEFTKKRVGKKRFVSYLKTEHRRAQKKRLFPSRLQLIIEYPVLHKAPALMPLIWVLRSIKKLFNHAKLTDDTKALQLERLKLFEEMEMLK